MKHCLEPPQSPGRSSIRFIEPRLPPPQAWVQYLDESYRQKTFANRGPAVRLLEKRLTERFLPPGRVAVTAANGTLALVAALHALKVQGLVCIPSFTFPATAHAVRLAGCIPLLCDVDPVSWEITPQTLAPAMAKGPSAIIHVRPFGLCRDLGPLNAWARAQKLPLIIDAASALGGRLPDGRAVGGDGDCEVFSMHATKPLGCGEGGVIAARADLVARIHEVVNFSLTENRDVVGPGGNSKMSDFQAAVGLGVLDGADAALAHRQQRLGQYGQLLASFSGIRGPTRPGSFPGQAMPILVPESTNNFQAEALAQTFGIETRRYYFPSLDTTKYFAQYALLGSSVVSRHLASQLLCLPCHLGVQDYDMSRIAQFLAELALAPRKSWTSDASVSSRAVL